MLRGFVCVRGRDELPKGSRGSGKNPVLFNGKIHPGLSLGPKHKPEHITLSRATVSGCLFQKMPKFGFPSCPSNSYRQLPRSFFKQQRVRDLLRQKGKAAGFSYQRQFRYHQVAPARRGETDHCRKREQQLLWRYISVCFAVTMHVYLCWCHLLSSHTGNPEFLWNSVLQPTLKHSQARWLSLPLRYFFSKLKLVFCRVNFHFSMASAPWTVTELTRTIQHPQLCFLSRPW